MNFIIQKMRDGRIIIKKGNGVNLTQTGSTPQSVSISTLNNNTEINAGTSRPKFIEVYNSSGDKLSDLTIGPSQVTQPGGSGSSWIIKFPQMGGSQSNVTLYYIAS